MATITTQDLVFNVTGTSETPARFRARVRHFEVLVDEPEELGGTDRAPNPVEYILVGFGGCLNVVAHLVAQELGISLKKLEIELQGVLNPARFLGQSDTERAGYKAIEVIFHVETEADEATLARWLEEVKDRCPVNDNLVHPTPVTLNVVKG